MWESGHAAWTQKLEEWKEVFPYKLWNFNFNFFFFLICGSLMKLLPKHCILWLLQILIILVLAFFHRLVLIIMVTKTVRHTRIAALNFLTLGHFPHPVFTQHWFCKSSRLLLSDKFVKVSTLYISFRFTIWVEKAEGKHSCLILLNLVFSKCHFQSHFLLMIWNPPHNYFSYVFFLPPWSDLQPFFLLWCVCLLSSLL